MNVGSPLIADTQPAKLMQPCQGSLDYPTVDSQAAAVLGEALGQDWLYPQRAQRISMLFRVISSVSLNTVRSSTRPSSPATDWWNALHQGQQLSHVVAISPGQDGGQGDSLGIGNQVVFAPRLAPVSGIRPGFSPHLPLLGWKRYPPLLETSRYGPFAVVWPAILHEASARPPLPASLGDDANNSCPTRIPSPWATSPKECHSSERTGFRSAPDGPAKACDQDNATGGALAVAARAVSVAIAHRLSIVSPSASPPHKVKLHPPGPNPQDNLASYC